MKILVAVVVYDAGLGVGRPKRGWFRIVVHTCAVGRVLGRHGGGSLDGIGWSTEECGRCARKESLRPRRSQ